MAAPQEDGQPVEVFIVIRFHRNNILCASLTVIIIYFMDSVNNS